MVRIKIIYGPFSTEIKHMRMLFFFKVIKFMGTFPLNKQQQSAVEFNGMHALVLAGAGTGKTRTIVARTQHLIWEGVEARRILLLTFTRRAAKEMVS